MAAPDKHTQARLQNDFGADYWVRNKQERRVRLPRAHIHRSAQVDPSYQIYRADTYIAINRRPWSVRRTAGRQAL